MNPAEGKGTQVGREHYAFDRYMSKSRWCSVWHQVDELVRLRAGRTLEIGPGPGFLKTILTDLGIRLETLDFASDIEADHHADARNLPFADGEFDVVCAFQVLEHVPFKDSLAIFGEMVRVARRVILVSLPDAERIWQYEIYVPRIGPVKWALRRPTRRLPNHVFDGEHYWEVNKRGYELQKVVASLGEHARLARTYRVAENPYHRFFVFEKGAGSESSR